MSAPESPSVGGSCLCGAVRFRATPPTKWVVHCHCTYCRRAHGAPFVTWASFPAANVVIDPEGTEPAWHESSPGTHRAFCPRCGTPMLFTAARWLGEMHVARALIPEALDREPSVHVFYDTHVPWLEVNDALPRKQPQPYAPARPAMQVLGVHASGVHAFSKDACTAIELVAGQGVRGDAHAGETVKHRSRVARDPTQPNLRQVHLLQGELLAELATRGLHVFPGQMGENITTLGIDLLALGEGTVLQLGASARVRITGLRNPCAQIEAFRPGLLAAVLDKTDDGQTLRKAGVMGVVLAPGPVATGDAIVVSEVPAPFVPLQPV